MATLPELENALRKAHAAGNADHARRFAAEIRRMRAEGNPEWQPTQRSVEDLRAMAGKVDPTEGNSFFKNATLGFGRSFVNTGEGIGQLLGLVDEEDIARRREIDAALMNTGGGQVGNFAGEVTQVLTPVPGAAGARLASMAGRAAPFIGAAGRGAAYAGAQGTVDGESRGRNALAGGALGAGGQGIAAGAGALAKRAAARLPTPVRDSIELARGAGIPLRADQVSASAPIKAVASVTRWLPFSGAGRAAQKQQEAFNAAVGRSFGADGAAVLSDDVMRGARRGLSDKFEDIYSRNDVPLDEAALRRLISIESNVGRRLTNDEVQVVRNQLDDILANADDGVLSGQKYQAVRTMLQKAEGPDKVGQAVKELRKELDDIAAGAVGPEDAAVLKKIRGQWANLRTAEDALKQVEGAKGNVKPAALWPLIRKGSTKEMRELARIGQNVLKDVVPDSGTAQRQLYQSMLTGGGPVGAAGAVVGLGSLGLLGKMAAGGIVGGRVLNSNVGSKLLEQGKPTSALARLIQPAPRLLPAMVPASAIDVSGGRVATQEEIERDAEIVRRFRQSQRR